MLAPVIPPVFAKPVEGRSKSLLLSVSVLAFVAPVLASRPAHARPDGCVTVGATTTCTGNQSEGIEPGVDFVTPPVATLIVRDITAPIRPASGEDGILFISNFVPTVTVRANFEPFDIVTLGDFANGVGAATEDGNVVITSTGGITTNGTRAHGVVGAVGGTGNVTVTQTGAIITLGQNSNGVLALVAGGVGATPGQGVGLGTGNARITSTGDIAVSGTSSDGLSAQTGRGNATIVSIGNISSQLGHGIQAVVETGNASIDSTGDILTNGVDRNGLQAVVATAGVSPSRRTEI